MTVHLPAPGMLGTAVMVESPIKQSELFASDNDRTTHSAVDNS